MSEKTKQLSIFDKLENQMLVVKPKVMSKIAFVYKGFTDLENLIKVLGKSPQINSDLSLQVKKFKIEPNSIIFIDSFGGIESVNKSEDFLNRYDIIINEPFNDSYLPKIQKPIK